MKGQYAAEVQLREESRDWTEKVFIEIGHDADNTQMLKRINTILDNLFEEEVVSWTLEELEFTPTRGDAYDYVVVFSTYYTYP